MMLLSQLFGTCAILCSLIIYSRRNKTKVLIFKCTQDICWLIHHLLLSAFPAAATSGLSITRSLAFYKDTREKSNDRIVLFLYIFLYAISAVMTWKNIFDFLPALSSILSTIAFWQKDVRYTKLLMIFASVCTLLYNVMVTNSITLYIGATITILTALISLLVNLKDFK